MLRKATIFGVLAGSVMAVLAGSPAVAGAAAPQSTSAALASAAVPTARLTKLVAEAKHQTTLGISYLYAGGHGSRPAPLNSHVDCSGLVRELYYYAFGVDIGGGSGDSMVRTSGEFTRTNSPVPGDVVLLGNGGSAPAYHSGVYIGTVNGEPAMVGSPTTGQNIKVQPSRGGSWGGDLMGYWHYKGATAADSGSLTAPAAAPVVRMRGSFDAVSARVGSFSVSGWALDPQRAGSGAFADVLIDGHPVATLGTPFVRSDVNRALRASGSHGFSATIGAGPGRHTICVTARPAGTSSRSVALGCKPITVPPTPTRGSFDRLTTIKGSFAVSGWAFDVRAPGVSNTVRISLDNRLVATLHTGTARPDVNRVFGLTGAHGFYARIGTFPSRHTVCIASMPATATSAPTNLGCKVIVTT